MLEQPPMIRQLSAPELKVLIESGAPFELVDVRTAWERDIASIAGSRLLDQASRLPAHLDQHDHRFQHGIRSQSVASTAWASGFESVHLRGGSTRGLLGPIGTRGPAGLAGLRLIDELRIQNSEFSSNSQFLIYNIRRRRPASRRPSSSDIADERFGRGEVMQWTQRSEPSARPLPDR